MATKAKRHVRASSDVGASFKAEDAAFDLHPADKRDVSCEDLSIRMHEHSHACDAKEVHGLLQPIPNMHVLLQGDEGLQGAHPVKARGALDAALVVGDEHHNLPNSPEWRR